MSIRGNWTVAAIFLALCFSSLPAADNGIRAGALELYPTFECIGVRLAYSGDADSNATVGLRYREKGAAAWRDALPPARIQKNRFAGSIFFLTPGRQYEVEVSLKDPDGVDKGQVTGSVATRAFDFPTGSKGRNWYVSPTGDDASKGSQDQPFRTISRAAAKVGPGDVVHVLPGLYHEQVEVKASGRPDAYIAFRAEGGGVILSGADPAFTRLDPGRWKAEGEGVYSAQLACRPGYLGADGVRLYHYIKRDEFDTFICGAPGGWFQDPSGKVYLKLSGDRNPNDLPVQAANLDIGFHLKSANYVSIEGFEIRDYGLVGSGAGVSLDSSGWCVVRDCSIHGMQSQIALSGVKAEGNLIENCDLWDTSLPEWPWAMTKAHEEEGGGVMSTGGRGDVVRGCRMHGLFDGMSPSYWDKLHDEVYNCDWDVYDNEIYYLRDDILEPEGPCINFRIWNNVCYDLFAGISLAPILVGPTYVMYNTLSELKIKDLKYNIDEPGWSYILQNTFYAGAWQHNSLDVGEPFQTQFYRNNIFYANSYGLQLRRRPLPNNDIDYDCWYSSDEAWRLGYTGLKDKRLFHIGGKDYPRIEAVRSEFGWEVHGIQADPLFAAPACRDFSLRPSSPCIDRGAVLPNINEGYVGKAPDLGAYEYGRAAVGAFPLGRNPASH